MISSHPISAAPISGSSILAMETVPGVTTYVAVATDSSSPGSICSQVNTPRVVRTVVGEVNVMAGILEALDAGITVSLEGLDAGATIAFTETVVGVGGLGRVQVFTAGSLKAQYYNIGLATGGI